MRVFMFSTAFAPNIGGIETLAALLAEEFVALGHEVRVMTDVLQRDEVTRPYLLHRGASATTYLAWLRWCDAHLQFNLSLKRLQPMLMRRHWFVSHQGEYVALDGHTRLRDRLKLAVARGANNIACSRFILRQLGCQGVAIGNAYDDRCFRRLAHAREHEFAFLGRLVSQKGCDVLLRALGELARIGLRPRLTVIGDGEERCHLEMREGGHRRGRLLGFRLQWSRKSPDEWVKAMDELARPRLGRKTRISGRQDSVLVDPGLL